MQFYRRVREIVKNDCKLRHDSVRMEQLGCHWTDFHEIWYFNTPPPPKFC